MIRKLHAAVLYLACALGANAAMADDLSSYATGEMANLVVHDTPVAASALPYLVTEETEGSLADFHGKHVVLNFWATWCAPCLHEMPMLDALQQELGGDDFQVVTLATGRNAPQAIRRFFDEADIANLTEYRDIGQQIAREMRVFGLPITVILDPEGREIARLTGDADWSSPEALALFRAMLDRVEG